MENEKLDIFPISPKNYLFFTKKSFNTARFKPGKRTELPNLRGGGANYLTKIFTPGCLGYIFLEYSSPDNAEKAVAGMDNYKLDKQHTFLVNLFSGNSFS